MRPKVYVTRLLPKTAMDRINSFCDADVWEGKLPPLREILLQKIHNAQGLPGKNAYLGCYRPTRDRRFLFGHTYGTLVLERQ